MTLVVTTVCLSVVAESTVESEQIPTVSRMSNPGLTSEAQLRYLLQWFGEFSELQREDFLPVLAAARSEQPDQLAAILANISCDDKPVSLFQCRIKLFNEWFPSWSEEEQDRLIKGVSEQDDAFGTKLQELLTNGPIVNGENHDTIEQNIQQNGTNEPHSPIEEANEGNGTWANGENREIAVENAVEDSPILSDNIPVEIAAAS